MKTYFLQSVFLLLLPCSGSVFCAEDEPRVEIKNLRDLQIAAVQELPKNYSVTGVTSALKRYKK